MAIKERPLLTDVFEQASDFTPDPRSVYIYGSSPEERSEAGQTWMTRGLDVDIARAVEQLPSEVTFEIQGTRVQLALRSETKLVGFLRQLKRERLYLDITGLTHQVWAPLMRAAFKAGITVNGIYVEPAEYKFSATPTEGEIFDLSERITGISPLPGFASLGEAREADICLVAFLGFEGARFSYIIEQVQPPGRNIFPVIGVPGFQPEFPFFAYHGNRFPLTQSLSWPNARYAIANCPFSAFYVLSDIAEIYPNYALKVAPIGTKPHGLGAVLFCIVSPRAVELIYDHPIRKPGRTSGTSRLLLYHLSSFAFPAAKQI
jgi:hypothetical protein